MFYFQNLFNTALSGIDAGGTTGGVVQIAQYILLGSRESARSDPAARRLTTIPDHLCPVLATLRPVRLDSLCCRAVRAGAVPGYRYWSTGADLHCELDDLQCVGAVVFNLRRIDSGDRDEFRE